MEESLDLRPTKIFNRYFVAVFICVVCNAISMQMFSTSLPLFIQNSGGSNGFTGLIISILYAASAAGMLISGPFIDRIGRRSVTALGLVLSAIATVLCIFFPIVWVYITLRIVQMMAAYAANVGTNTMLTDVVPMERLGEATAYYGISQTFATAIGPALALMLIRSDGTDFSLSYIATVLLLIVGTFSVSTCNYERKWKPKSKPKNTEVADCNSDRNIFYRFIEPKAIPATLLMFCFYIACSFVINYLVLYSKEYNIPNISFSFTMMAIGMLLGRLLTSQLANRYGDFLMATIGFSVGVISFVLILVASWVPGIIHPATLLCGAAVGVVEPILNVVAVKKSPELRRGVALSTYGTAFVLGVGLGALVLGVLIDMSGYRISLIVCIGLTLLSLLFCVKLFRTKKSK